MSKTIAHFEAVATIAKRHNFNASTLDKRLEFASIDPLVYGWVLHEKEAFEPLFTLVVWGDSDELLKFIARKEEERKSKNFKK